jgi:hypothetical protein
MDIGLIGLIESYTACQSYVTPGAEIPPTLTHPMMPRGAGDS